MAHQQSVDEQIVQMRFDNADFQTKVAQTLESLTKLRESTKMEDAGKGMENLSKGVKNVDINSLAASVEQLNSRFSALGIMGQEVMRNLADAAMRMGKQVVDAITMAPRDGWKEFELNTDSIKTILNSAKDANGLPVTLDLVNKKLNELNKYSDQTIYSFSDMTSNIGKFTNAGVDLESAVTAIKGVANVAALAGASSADASRAMYNFGQALGSGSVLLRDWMSIENANMATIDFKQSLIDTAEEMGVLIKKGDKWVSTTTNAAGKTSDAFNASENFRDSLNHQWMTAEVLTKTLEKYTKVGTPLGDAAIEAATKVNTLTKLLDTLKESMGSGWMETWQHVFGDYEEATELWTGIYRELDSIIQKTAEFRNNLLKTWKDLGGRNDLIDAFANLWSAAKDFIVPIRDLFLNLLPPVSGESLAKLTNGFKQFTEKLAPAKKAAEDVGKKVEEIKEGVEEVTDRAEKFNEVVQEILAGKWGNGQERIDKLHEAGYAFENLQNAVNGVLGCEKRYETVMSDNEAVGEKVVESTKDLVETQVDYKEAIQDTSAVVWEHNSAIDNMAYLVLGVGSALKLAVAVVNKGVDSFKKLSGGIHPVRYAFELLMDVLGNLGRHMYTLNTWLIQFDSIGSVFTGIKQKIGEFNEAFKSIGQGNALSNVVVLVERLQVRFDFLKGKIQEFADKIRDLASENGLKDVKAKFDVIGKYVGGALLLAVNQLAKAFNTLLTSAEKLWNKLSNLEVVLKVKEQFEEAKAAIKGFWENLNETSTGNQQYVDVLHDLAEGLRIVSSVIGTVFTNAFSALMFLLDKFNDAMHHAFETFQNNGLVTQAGRVVENFKKVFEKLPEITQRFFESLKQGKIPSLNELSASLGNFVGSVRAFAGQLNGGLTKLWEDMVGKIVEGVMSLSNISLPKGLESFVEKIKGIFSEFGEFTGDAGSTIQKFITNVVDKIKGLDLKGGAIAALIGAVALFVARWSKVGKNASKTLKSITTFIKNGGKAASFSDKMSGFLKIAASLLIVAAAIWVLAKVPAERFKECAITLGVAFGAMLGAMLLLNKFGDADKLKATALAFAGIGAGVLLLSAAVKAFAMLKPEEIVKGLSLVGVAIVGMIAAIKMVGDVSNGTGAAFAGLAAGVLILSIAVRSFAAIKPAALLKGGAAVTVFIFEMAAAMKLAGNSKSEGFVKLAAAIVILVLAVKAISRMKTGAMVKGIAGVTVLIAAMAIASRSAKDVNGDAFKSMAQAIKILTAAMWILSKIPTLSLIAITASLVLIFKTLTSAMKELKKMDPKDSGKVILALIALLLPIGVCLGILAQLPNADKILPIAVGIAAILWALGKIGPAVKVLSSIDLVAGIKAAGLMDVFIAAIAALLAALGGLDVLTNGELGDAMVRGSEMLGRCIHGFIQALIFGETDPSAVLNSIGEAFSTFGERVSNFIDTVTNLDPSVGENAKNLAAAILAIAAAEVLEAVAGWAMGKSNFEGFGDSIKSVTEALMDINNSVKDGGFDSKGVKQVIKCIKLLVEVADALPRQGGLVQKLIGVKDLGDFGKQMAIFVKGGFKLFVEGIEDVSDKLNVGFEMKVMMVSRCTKALINLANKMPPIKSDFMAFFTGKQDLGEFAGQMAQFMSGGFVEFLDAVRGIPETDVGVINSTVKPATEGMISLAKQLKGESSLLSWFTDKSDLSMFGTTLAQFGQGLKDFSIAIAGIKLESVDAVRESVSKFGELNANENLNAEGLFAISTSLDTLGVGLSEFYNSTTSITPEYMTTMIEKLSELHNVLLVLAGSNYEGVGNFVAALQELAEAGVSGFIEQFNKEAGNAAEAAENLVQIITKTVEAKYSDFAFTGGKLMMQFCNGFANKYRFMAKTSAVAVTQRMISGIKGKLNDFYNAGGSAALKFCVGLSEKNKGMIKGAGQSAAKTALEGVSGYYDDFYDEGQNDAKGYALGIESYIWKAKEAARKMVREAKEAAKQEADSHSPSRVFRKEGQNDAEGFGLGFLDMISFVKMCATKTVDAGLYAMQQSIQQTNNLISDELDYTPTITPVMDLSLVASGIQSSNRMLSSLNGVTTDAKAAIDIAALHNENLASSKANANRDYSKILAILNDNTQKLINAANKPNVAVIDGDYLFGYVDRRMGMA